MTPDNFAPLVGTPHHRSPIMFIVCPRNHGTYIHKDATRWYCVGCRTVHFVPVQDNI